MPRNIEIKAKVSGLDAIRAKASVLSAHPSEVLQQTDTFFAISQGRLKVREFSDGSGELISYERPDQTGPKESAYTRCPCGNARLLSETLSRALKIRGIVAKRREVFLVGRIRVHLDQVEGLGSFVELEVVLNDGEPAVQGERDAHGLLRTLQIPQTALVAQSYIDLLSGLGKGGHTPNSRA